MRTHFFQKLPQMPSHYCRASASKIYLEPATPTMTDVYKLHKEKCIEHNRAPLSGQVFVDKFEKMKMNLALFKPEKDQCDACVLLMRYVTLRMRCGRSTDKKDQARDEKTVKRSMRFNIGQQPGYEGQKTCCVHGQFCFVFTLFASISTRLQANLFVHNFTVYNLATHEAMCFVWHEGEGELSSVHNM